MVRMGTRSALVGACLALVAATAEARPDEHRLAVAAVRAPLGFEPNRGQAAAEVEFLTRGRSYVLALTRGDAVLTVGGATVRMRAIGANPAPDVAARDPLAGRVSYLTGGDRTRWRTGIPTYARVLYRDVYPAIDLVYHGSQGLLEYDFLVAPGADPATIRLAFDGTDGLALDEDGALRLTTPTRSGTAPVRRSPAGTCSGGRRSRSGPAPTIAPARSSSTPYSSGRATWAGASSTAPPPSPWTPRATCT
jgi:hypothetical protein